MIDTRGMTPAEIRKAATEAVIREVGVVGLVELLRDEHPGSGDYVFDREKWLPEFGSTRELFEAIERDRKDWKDDPSLTG